MDFIFLITLWMNPSSYGLVGLIQCVVEPIHLWTCNFEFNVWLNLSSYGLLILIQRVVELVLFMGESVYFGLNIQITL